ncbi:hypothetical protein Tco_0424612 [Tanacetum coccineum]
MPLPCKPLTHIAHETYRHVVKEYHLVMVVALQGDEAITATVVSVIAHKAANVMDSIYRDYTACLSWTDISQANTISFESDYECPREARLNKIAEEDKQRKCLRHMNSSAHIKLAIERCVPKKRKYVDVLRSPFCALPKILNVPSIEQLANQKNVLNPFMIEKYKSVKP